MALLLFTPQYITVHLGSPDSGAANVTVTFPEYIKNVASSEVYPTWPESALRANVLAQTSFALNRVGTGYYRSRGYNFDITNDKSVDRSFVNGRCIFENIGQIVDETLGDYISRKGSDEPMLCVYCSGSDAACTGLSKWGSFELSKQGMETDGILKNYYGDDIEIITNTPVKGFASYPSRPLQPGSASNDVKSVQILLNRISTNYPLIPKINPVNGVFGRETEEAVKAFQHIFNLVSDGIVGKSSWYKIQYVSGEAKKLCSLTLTSMAFDNVSEQYHDILKEGDTGPAVTQIQYFLTFAAQYIPAINPIHITGDFDAETTAAVMAFRHYLELTDDGIVDKETYNKLFDVYISLTRAPNGTLFCSRARPLPRTPLFLGIENENVAYMKECLNCIAGTYTTIPFLTADGVFDKKTRDAVMTYQKLFDLPQNDIVDLVTWNSIGTLYDDLRAGRYVIEGQYPGYVIDEWLSAEGEGT